MMHLSYIVYSLALSGYSIFSVTRLHSDCQVLPGITHYE